MDRKRLGRGQQDTASIESRTLRGDACMRASLQGQVIDRRTAVRVEGRADVRAEKVPYGNKEES